MSNAVYKHAGRGIDRALAQHEGKHRVRWKGENGERSCPRVHRHLDRVAAEPIPLFPVGTVQLRDENLRTVQIVGRIDAHQAVIAHRQIKNGVVAPAKGQRGEKKLEKRRGTRVGRSHAEMKARGSDCGSYQIGRRLNTVHRRNGTTTYR